MAHTADWLAEQHAADQRRFLTLVAGSLVAHAVLLAIVGLAPSRPRPSSLEIVRVDLVALPAPGAPPAPAPPKPAAAPAPKKPAPKPTPPPPQPKQIVLPKEAPAAVKKPVVKPRPPEPVVAPPQPRPEPIDYDDALSQLREELGEETPRAPQAETQTTTDAPGVSEGDDANARAAAEASAWHQAIIRHLRSCWITPPEFLNRLLSTGLEVRLTEAGDVLGEPRVTRRSGDPFFDENAVRAVMRCTPLPPPPAAGTWQFAFTSEVR